MSRRWLWSAVAGLLVVGLVAAAAVLLLRDRPDGAGREAAPPAADGLAPRVPPATAPPASAPPPGPGASPTTPGVSPPPAPQATASCAYLPAPPGPLEETAAAPPPQASVPQRSRVRLRTSAGPVVIELAGAAAPCTVNAFLSLVRGDYYRETPCHRLTTESIHVLQCGDPSGSGQGGPGWQFADENLPPGATYPRGTVAMANSGPATNGSQFFLVYRDSPIDPNYPVFGTVTEGLDVLDRIAAAGTEEGTGDGQPKTTVTIEAAELL
jgi:peptidyl-prolyl cis-trans isomerase B (cyclophilin B)